MLLVCCRRIKKITKYNCFALIFSVEMLLEQK